MTRSGTHPILPNPYQFKHLDSYYFTWTGDLPWVYDEILAVCPHGKATELKKEGDQWYWVMHDNS